MRKVHLLSLGCPKNLVDSEKLLKKLEKKGICYSSNSKDSDIILVNTCGFIEDARRESVGEILRIAEEKGNNGVKKLVVFGCLAERSGEELKKEIPEIDALWGVADEDEIVEYCEKIIKSEDTAAGRGDVGTSVHERFVDTPYAYLKIAEGCNRGCSFCVIPRIRGAYRSRGPEEVLNEAEGLVKSGIKELIVIAQDITSYGRDIGGYDLSRLIRDIASLEGDFWIRLLYLYPASLTEKLLETISAEKKICKYIDMPLQHSEERILKLMERGGNSRQFEKLIRRTRDIIPEVNIRTSFIVGFPHESDEDFEGLMEFVRKIKFDRLGVFTYSREEGTSAFSLKGQVPGRTKKARYEKIMEMQSAISLAKNKKLVGKTFRALVDDVDDKVAVARLHSQAPEIDGVVLIEQRNMVKGGFVQVKITGAYDYDLKGDVVR